MPLSIVNNSTFRSSCRNSSPGTVISIQSGKAVFVAASGANRVNEKRLKEYAGEGIEKTRPEFVRETTGFAIGGVSPVGHFHLIESCVDEDLLGYAELWAAAGMLNAVFRLTPADLTQLTAGRVVSIA